MQPPGHNEQPKENALLRQGRRCSAPAAIGHSTSSPSLPQIQRSRAKNIQQVALFCDLRGFTSMCERLSDHPEVVLRELLPFHEEFVRAIKVFGGSVVNIYGDAVFAVFQVGRQEPESEVAAASAESPMLTIPQACFGAMCAANQMLMEIKRLNLIRMSSGLRPFCFGIGIDFGIICHASLSGVAVNIGCPANIAQRLEDLNKEERIRAALGCPSPVAPFSSMIISGTVYDQLPEDLSYRFNGRMIPFEKRSL